MDADGRLLPWGRRPSEFASADLTDDEERSPMALGSLPRARHDKASAADETGLRSEIIRVIRHAADNAPRSLQRRVGPSEVGTPCARQLTYKVAGYESAPGRDSVHDPFPSILGTAGHAWLADAFEMANAEATRRGEPEPWMIEHRLDVGFGLRGSGDLFHVPTGVTWDHKILGNTQYAKYVSDGPSETYRVQGHTYGLGWERAGFTVNRVAIGFFGRAKKLSDLYVWSEPYDRTVALRALKRLREVQRVVEAGAHPQRVPATPGGQCYFCSYVGRTEDGFCPGKDA